MTDRWRNVIGVLIFLAALVVALLLVSVLGTHAQNPPTPPPKVPPPDPTIRMYPGGSTDAPVSYTDCNGNLWSTDAGYFSSGTATNYVSTNAPPIMQATPCTDSQPLYQHPRVSNGATLTLTYNNIPPGTYQLEMKYAEVYYTLPGQRVMNISVNAKPWLENFDIIALTNGRGIAIDEITNITTGGQVQIVIQNVKGGAIYEGVQLVPYVTYSVTLQWANPTHDPFGIGYSVSFSQATDATGTNWNMLAQSYTDGTGTATGTAAWNPKLPYVFRMDIFNTTTGLYMTELNSGNVTGITAGTDQAFLNQQVSTGIKATIRVNPVTFVVANILWDAAN